MRTFLVALTLAAASATEGDGASPRELVIAGVSGGIATAFGDFCMHPVDTIKTVQQSAPAGSAAAGIPGAVKQLLDGGGVGALYQGAGVYCLMDGLAGIVKFSTYEVLKAKVEPRIPEEYVPASRFVLAGLAFIACSVVMVPGELVKQRLQSGMYTSLLGGVAQLWKEEGLPGFFTGYGAVLLRDLPYTMMELGIYDQLKEFVASLNLAALGGAGGEETAAAAITGGFIGFITNPLDLIKTRLMVNGVAASPFAVGAGIVATEGGIPALFNGSIARTMWLMPFTMIYLPVYEVIKRALSDKFPAEGAGASRTAFVGAPAKLRFPAAAKARSLGSLRAPRAVAHVHPRLASFMSGPRGTPIM